MQLISKGLSVILSSAFTLSSVSARLSAQQATAVETSTSLPEAPSPQFAMPVGQSSAQQAPNQVSQISSPSSSAASPQETGSISGTVTDLNGDVVPGATVTLDSKLSSDQRQIAVDDNGAFAFDGLRGNTSYRITVGREGFVTWTSEEV